MSDRRSAFVVSRLPLRSLVLLASVALVAGCGDGKIKCYPVSGSVTVGGLPYPGARVMLVPIGGGEKLQKERPFGVTDATGRFELTTFEKGDGAPSGEYKVMIRSGSPRDQEQAQAWANRPRLDPKYAKPDLSGITATVAEEATELEPFVVTPAQRR